MSTKIKAVLALIIFAAFFLVVSSAYKSLSENYRENNGNGTESSDYSPFQMESKKVPAPDFTVFDEKGNEVKLSDFKGKPVVVNFWASWCPPCKAEMPHFNKVYREIKDDVVFMMVDLVDRQRETREKGQNYIKEQGYSFPVYFDLEQEAAFIYGISSIPTTLFIDAEGNIIASREGILEEETLKTGINLIMEKQ